LIPISLIHELIQIVLGKQVYDVVYMGIVASILIYIGFLFTNYICDIFSGNSYTRFYQERQLSLFQSHPTFSVYLEEVLKTIPGGYKFWEVLRECSMEHGRIIIGIKNLQNILFAIVFRCTLRRTSN